MTEIDDLKQCINKLEERIDYLEKKFNVNSNSSEILFPTMVNVVHAEIKTANGDEHNE